MTTLPPNLRLLSGLAFLVTCTNLNASITFYVSTDANGDFINASAGGASGTPAAWSGDGTVQMNFNSTTNPGATPTLISGFSSGTLSNLSMDRDGTFFDYTFSLIAADTSMAASADIIGTFANGTEDDDWRGMAINNMTNVAGLSVKTTFAEPIAARNNSAVSTPWGIGMRRHSGSASTYDVTSATYSGLTTITSLPASGVAPVQGTHYDTGITGVMAGGGLVNLQNSLLADPGPPPFPSITSTNTSAMTGITDTSQWIGLHGVDFDGLTGGDGAVDNSSGSNGILDNDTERTYLNMVEFVVAESDGNAFPTNTRFQFTIDGSQYADTVDIAIAAGITIVPEPSRAALLMVGLGVVLSQRHRRQS